MADYEKVIKGLECCTSKPEHNCGECPYYGEKSNDGWPCNSPEMKADALELLKEYKRKEECPCTHCTEYECEEVCEEYKKWRDT